MRINGEWLVCDDGIVRPVVPAWFRAADGVWTEVIFLLDAGADRTVFSAHFLDALQPLQLSGDSVRLAGIGGEAGVIMVDTAIGFQADNQRLVTVRGPFGAFTETESGDLSVLGRDVTNNFSVIYDYPQRIVALLASPHSCEIKPK